MDVSLLQEKSTFPVLTMRMSPHLEPFFFFLIYDCILHKCCAISNQYHFTNPISTFLPKFQGGSGPPVPPSGSAHVRLRAVEGGSAGQSYSWFSRCDLLLTIFNTNFRGIIFSLISNITRTSVWI